MATSGASRTVVAPDVDVVVAAPLVVTGSDSSDEVTVVTVDGVVAVREVVVVLVDLVVVVFDDFFTDFVVLTGERRHLHPAATCL